MSRTCSNLDVNTILQVNVDYYKLIYYLIFPQHMFYLVFSTTCSVLILIINKNSVWCSDSLTLHGVKSLMFSP